MRTDQKLSIGVPTRNQARYLDQTLASLVSQVLPPLEIVVSDHHSTDDTPEVIASYVRRYPHLIKAVRPPLNSSLTDQYNFTLASQAGDWITLLSSDDIALPNFTAAFTAAAQSAPNAAALIRAPWRVIDSTGNQVSEKHLLSVPKIQYAPDTLLSQQNGPKVSFAAFAVRRSAWERSGRILQQMESLADWALFVQLTPYGSYIRINDVVSGYRVGHEGDKFYDRGDMWIRDEYRMFQNVIPTAAHAMGLQKLDWIEAASKANFLRYLAAASIELPFERRELLIPDFKPWAESVNQLSALQRFSAGEVIRESRSVGRTVRNLLRPLAHRAAGVVRR